MVTAFIVIGSVVGYLGVGLVYARSQLVACYDRARAEWHSGWAVDDSVAMQILWRVALWPIAVVLDCTADRFEAWFLKPENDRKKKVAQLRRELDGWENVRRDRNRSDAEREVASELVSVLRERLADLENGRGRRKV